MDVTAWLDSGDTSPLVQPPAGISLNPLPLSGLSSPVGAVSVEGLAATPLLPAAVETASEPLLLPSSASGSIDPLTGLDSNAFVVSPQAAGALPDLVVTAASVTPHATWGQKVNVTWTVTNQGSGIAGGGWNDAFYLSTDPIWDENDRPLGIDISVSGRPAFISVERQLY
jgi:hypothetical protein